MIKKIFFTAFFLIPIYMIAQTPTFGIINTQSILDAMPETQAAKAQLDSLSNRFEAEYNIMQLELEKKYSEFQNQNQDSMTPSTIKERRMQELQELDYRMQQFRQTATQELNRQREVLMYPINAKLDSVINVVGVEAKFTLILEDVQPRFISSDVIDVTPVVKAKLGLNQ